MCGLSILFFKASTNLNLEMTIDTSRDEHYEVEMPFKK